MDSSRAKTIDFLKEFFFLSFFSVFLISFIFNTEGAQVSFFFFFILRLVFLLAKVFRTPIFFYIRSSLPLLTAAFHFVWRTVVNLYLIWCRDNVIASDTNIVIHHLDERRNWNDRSLFLKISLICNNKVPDVICFCTNYFRFWRFK